MNYALQKDNLIRSKGLKKVNILVFVILAVFLYLIFHIVSIQNRTALDPYIAGEKFYSLSNVQFSTSPSILLPWIVISLLVFVILAPIGLFTTAKPKPLSDIIQSSVFQISFQQSQEAKEIGIINLEQGSFTITWEDNTGTPQNWKIKIELNYIDNENFFTSFARYLFMERSSPENKFFKKVILVKDWPKQEYLINYWLKGLK